MEDLIEKNNQIKNEVNKILNEVVSQVEQSEMLHSKVGEAINTGFDIGIRAICPDYLESQVINLKDNFIKDMSDKKQVLSIRILVVVFIAISSILALIQYKSSITFIAQLMGVSWGALAGSFLAPFMYSLYSKRVTKASCWVCFIFSSVLMIANIFFRSSFPTIMQSPINCGAIAMLAGLVIVPVVSLFTPKPDKELVESAFKCYDKKTTVEQKTALGD